MNQIKLHLTKLSTFPIFQKCWKIVEIIGILLLVVGFCIFYLLATICWMLSMFFEFIMIIPFFFVWLFTGKKLWFKLNCWLEEKFVKILP